MNLSAIVLASGIALAAGLGAAVLAQSQPAPGGVPNVSGTYSGRRCVPANSDVCPEMNVKGAERLMTARGKALIAAFDEVAAPKYDCSPATLPIIFGDPWAVKIEQLPDRVNFTYEKDDVTRTVWLEGKGHQPPRNGLLFMHGYSTGRYEGNQLVIETSRFTFDPEGFAGDALNAPSSTQKRLVERYSRSWRRPAAGADGRGSGVPARADQLHDGAARDRRAAVAALGLRSGGGAAQPARGQVQVPAGSADQSKELTMTKPAALVGAIILGSAITAAAHHGQVGLFDESKITELKGTVKRWIFTNPHPILVVEAPDDKGVKTDWDVYFGPAAVPSLRRQGFSIDTFKTGRSVGDQGPPRHQRRAGPGRARQGHRCRARRRPRRTVTTTTATRSAILLPRQLTPLPPIPPPFDPPQADAVVTWIPVG